MLWVDLVIALLVATVIALAVWSRHLATLVRALGEAAVTDNLTGLWDYGHWRAGLLDVAADAGEPVGVVFLDLDGFKQINSVYGHLEADAILAEVGRRLAVPPAPLRHFCRFGGDEFAGWALPADGRSLDEVCGELVRELTRPIPLPSGAVRVEACVGRAIARTGEIDTAIAAAELDLRRRKLARTEDPSTRISQKDAQGRLIREVLAEGGVDLAYQPIVDLDDDRIIGWEALLRATSSTLGQLPPPTLIASASAAGRLDELTWIVAGRALATTREAAEKVGERLALTINIELEQLRADSGLLDRVVAAYDADRVHLVLEVSERGIGAWDAGHADVARELAAHRVGLAVDDLGSGQSRMPIVLRHQWDFVKLDRDLLHGDLASVCTTMRHIVAMIRDLGMVPLVEGVETPEQLAILREAGVRLVQGNLLYRPLASADLLEMVSTRMAR